MKYLLLTLKALLLVVVGSIVYLWDNITYTQGATIVDTSKTMKQVWEEYKEYWLKHEPTMTEPSSCRPNTKQEVDALERSLSITLPSDFKTSLLFVKHGSKKCDDNLHHSWFGSKTGIELYETKTILSETISLRKHEELDIRDYNIYWNEITPIDKTLKTWSKQWLPIASKYDIVFFIDLREDIGKQYGQVLAFLPTTEGGKNGVKPPEHLLKQIDNYTPNPNNAYNNFVYIAPDYKTFMQLMLEEIKANGKLKDRYLTNLFNLPSFYFW